MVGHELVVQGVSPAWLGQPKPALLQMHDDDFPARFLTDLSALAIAPGSNVSFIQTSSSTPATLYQPVHRVLHVGLLQLACDSVSFPRLDPTRVDSAGLVIRRIVQNNGVDDLAALPSAWVRFPDGRFQWLKQDKLQECQDPNPAKRPLLESGQPELDRMLAAQTLATAPAEVFTPAFVAPPEVCDAANRTLVYGVLPTASSDVSTNAPPTPQYDPSALAGILPTLLQANDHSFPMPDEAVDYRYMSDDFAKANSGATFLPFSVALRLMYTVFGAFDDTPQATALLSFLNRYFVHFRSGAPLPMGEYFQYAASALIDFDPSTGTAPLLTMPHSWDTITDQNGLLSTISTVLQARSSQVSSPVARFQDARRLYRFRIFLRIKPHAPGCPPKLVWSQFSDPFRIAAWHESAGRTTAPIPLPDPTDKNTLKNAKPNCSFAVPAGLMNAMQGTTLSGLSSGSGGGSGGGGLQLGWICGFSIPLITICAFFVLNIFLTLLNLVFFWLPFIKICIPFPLPTPANTGDTDG